MKSMKKKVNVPFNQQGHRFKNGILVTNSNPGPGKYEDNFTLSRQIDRKTALSTNEGFTSNTSRFKQGQSMETQNENPGPGTYFQENEDSVQVVEPPQSNHYFASKSKRDVFIKKNSLNTPVVGSYDLSYYDMYYPVNKYM